MLQPLPVGLFVDRKQQTRACRNWVCRSVVKDGKITLIGRGPEIQKERRTHGRSQNPDQGARRQHKARRPLSGAWSKAARLEGSRALRLRLVVFCETVLDARNVNQVFAAASIYATVEFGLISLPIIKATGTTPIASGKHSIPAEAVLPGCANLRICGFAKTWSRTRRMLNVRA